MDQNYMKESSFELLKASIEAKISDQNDNFTKNELLGRGLLKSFLQQKKITDYTFTEGKFDKVDGYLHLQKEWAVEIKVRADSAEAYDTLFLEVTKFKAMVELIKQDKVQEGLYINFIGNKLYIFNIRNICKALKQNKAYISCRYCNRTTAEESGKTDKRMIEIPKSIAEEYEFIEGRWAKVRP